ncbi:MAG TPA: alpha/beta fold hydrolase [Terracidiphilus sp.]|jgi:pimeloyl-ACP methyl ester carboxylesterase|nr:alpha/beta fold hydrolase [Terracidiphilus sp.]
MSKSRSRSKPPARSKPHLIAAGEAPTVVSGSWLLKAVVGVVVAAAFCVWGTLGLLFWQGSWQLLYHPTATITRTPASVGLPFEDVAFATNDAGIPQLKGWWIPANSVRPYTAIYLHSADGNLGNTVEALAQLHAAGLSILAIDYRNYGASQHAHPSEKHWREDAESGLRYLTDTRHIAANSIVVVGNGLGANLALEVASAHPDLAGALLNQPVNDPTSAIFNDPRAGMIPAHLLVADRWDPTTPATDLRDPSLWFFLDSGQIDRATLPISRVTSPKTVVWLPADRNQSSDFSAALTRWLDNLPALRSH